MTTAEIISKFSLYVDDGTELSSQEELDLANKVYRKVCNFRPWEFLKETSTGSISNNQISLPTDFKYVYSNYQSTDPTVSQETTTAPKVIFVGSDLNPIRLVNFSDRRTYRADDVAYIDPTDSKIKFTQSHSGTYEFDYIKAPAALTLSTSPIFHEDFHDIIYLGMAVDDFAIQLFDKSRSYANENQVKFNDILKDLSYANAMQNFN